jgi:hypothetical protein
MNDKLVNLIIVLLTEAIDSGLTEDKDIVVCLGTLNAVLLHNRFGVVERELNLMKIAQRALSVFHVLDEEEDDGEDEDDTNKE